MLVGGDVVRPCHAGNDWRVDDVDERPISRH